MEASSLFGREAPVVRREATVLLSAEGGFPFGRRPKVLLAVGELFVRARSARSQARSACAIARRRRTLCSGAKRLCYCPPKSGFHSAEGRRFCSPALCLPVLLPTVGELFVWARSARSQARSACVIV